MKLILVTLLALLTFVNCDQSCSCGKQKFSKRIIGGYEAPNTHPYMVSLLKRAHAPTVSYDYHNCGGTLISDRWILTAGHCIESVENGPDPIRVVMGNRQSLEFLREEYQAKSLVDFTIKHPDYMAFADIGLMRLAEPVKFNSTFYPLCLPTEDMMEFDELTAIGWGASGPGENPWVLQETKIKYHPNEECKKTFPGMGGDHHICVHSEDTGICGGDSGSPLIAEKDGRKYHVGAFNIYWGGLDVDGKRKHNCSKGNWPVYARTTYFLKWILETIKEHGGEFCQDSPVKA